MAKPHKRVMVVFGTRPEAIKMAPVVSALKANPGIQTSVVVTAQHRHMLDQALSLFGIVPDHDLDAMEPDQSLPDLFSKILQGMSSVIAHRKPDLVLVHGDTTTTFATTLASFYNKIPVGHVEAGLRTGDLRAPWPEEMNRRLTAPIASLHFAPTQSSKTNLLAEGVVENSIHVTGNTVIDALLTIVEKIKSDPKLQSELAAKFPLIDHAKKMILVTGHRRENYGAGFEKICQSLITIADREDTQVVYSLHLNPNFKIPAERLLSRHPNIFLIKPQEYLPFVYLMLRSHLIITDSGGIQEEAPSLGKPVLVTRELTERPEAVDKGTVRLVGTNSSLIVSETFRLLDDEYAYSAMSRIDNPYGDGHAAERIARIILTTDA